MTITEKQLQSVAGSELDGTRLARAIWAKVTEPADPVLGALMAALGPVEALSWLASATGQGRAESSMPAEFARLELKMRRRLVAAMQRWGARVQEIDVAREIKALESFDGVLVTPEDTAWPQGLNDLGFEAPACLWVRGKGDLGAITSNSVALVGARAATAYGEDVTMQLATGLVDRSFTVISGGAYGIDIAAHRATLAAQGITVAVLAGGADRLYPKGNAQALTRILDSGLIVSEHPPGSAPTRARFLTRNRLIAALARATVVVEAAWRSGAISTARHAAKLGRALGAVPGPVTSMMSAGCHSLLRDETAVCVTDADEVAELAGRIGENLAPATPRAPTLFDSLDGTEAAVFEALPVRKPATVVSVARTAGLSFEVTMATLARLELREIAVREGQAWRRNRD